MLHFMLALSLSAPGDRWFGADKAKHFFVGAFVQSVSYTGLRVAGVNHQTSLIAASATTVTVALGKEVHDRGGRGTPSARDFVWGVAGAAAVTPLLAATRR